MSGAASLFCDGGARGNPGPAGAAAVLYNDQGQEIASRGEYLGPTTNNVAEYRGVLIGLALAKTHAVQRLRIFLDSELVVRQISGQYKVRHPGLLPYWQKVQSMLSGLTQWEIGHIPRAENAAADRLVNQAIDRHFKTAI